MIPTRDTIIEHCSHEHSRCYGTTGPHRFSLYRWDDSWHFQIESSPPIHWTWEAGARATSRELMDLTMRLIDCYHNKKSLPSNILEIQE